MFVGVLLDDRPCLQDLQDHPLALNDEILETRDYHVVSFSYNPVLSQNYQMRIG